MQIGSLGRGDPLEEGMAVRSSILAWRIPWTEGCGLPSMGSQQRQKQSELACTAALPFVFSSRDWRGEEWYAPSLSSKSQDKWSIPTFTMY